MTLRYQNKDILSFRNSRFGLDPALNLWTDFPMLETLHDPTVAYYYFNDFRSMITATEGWTTLVADGGAATIVAATSGRNGILSMAVTDATDNDEMNVGETNKPVILGSGKDLWFEASVKFTEANTDDANILVGLSDTAGANILQDNGAGPAASYDGIIFFKVDGGTVWQTETSVTTTPTTTTSAQTRVSGSWSRLGFKATGNSQVTFYINGVAVSSHTATLPTAAMGILFSAKNGDTNAETLFVDWVRVGQLR